MPLFDAPLEFWRVSPPRLGVAGERAARLEDAGWDGMTVGDSQNIAPDSYVVLTRAMEATSTIRLCTWVTNPISRHAAVAAGALATLQCESEGRFEVGIGRGDSALAHLGLSPAPLGYFEEYLRRLRGFLNGEEVPHSNGQDSLGVLDGAEKLGLGDRPVETSRLRWLPNDYRPVPVVVAASGPKVMAIGARTADKVTAVVGPTVKRLSWARDQILSAEQEQRTMDRPLVLGTSCVVAVNEDREVARTMARPISGVQARFAVLHNKINGPTSDAVASGLHELRRNYDMNRHAAKGAKQSSVLPDEVVDDFAIAGPAGYVTERLIEIAELGYRRFTISVESPDVDQELVDASEQALGETVLQAVRSAIG